MDYTVRKSNKRDYDFSNEQINYIINLYKSGTPTAKIGELFGVSYKTICRLLDRNGISLTGVGQRKYKVDQNYFDIVDSPNKAYILGFLFADGSNCASKDTITISLQESDRQILEDMRTELKSEKPLEYLDYSNKHDGGYNYKNQYRLIVFSKHMCDTLNNLGMMPNKSLQLKFPNIPEQYYSHFIRGYFDGDGSISATHSIYGNVSPNFSIVSTKNFCISVKKILEDILGVDNIRISDASCHNGITMTLYVYSRRSIKIIMDWLYQDADMFLKRKYQKYLEVFYAVA